MAVFVGVGVTVAVGVGVQAAHVGSQAITHAGKVGYGGKVGHGSGVGVPAVGVGVVVPSGHNCS